METYGNLMYRLRVRLDEVGGSRRWKDEPLLHKLFDGAKDVARKSEAIRTTANIVAVAGTQQYLMANDIVRVHRVTFTPHSDTRVIPLEYMDFMSADAVWWTQQTVAEANSPAIYTMWGAPPNLTLVAYPTPDNAGTFTVFYYKLPLGPFVDDMGMAIDDPDDRLLVICEIPQGWDDCVIDYATYMAMLEDNNPQWQTHKALYEEHMADLTITAQRFNDQAGMIVPDSGYGGVPRFIWDENY